MCSQVLKYAKAAILSRFTPFMRFRDAQRRGPQRRRFLKLVLVTFPELNQAFDVGERLTLPLPVSFDPVKGVDLIFQLPWRKLSRGCIFFDNAHTQCFEKIWLLTYSRQQIAVN